MSIWVNVVFWMFIFFLVLFFTSHSIFLSANHFFKYLVENKIELGRRFLGHTPAIFHFHYPNSVLKIGSFYFASHPMQRISSNLLMLVFMAHLKKKWKSFSKMFKLKNGGREIQMHLIPKHINDLGLSFFNFGIQSAFQDCGLFPLMRMLQFTKNWFLNWNQKNCDDRKELVPIVDSKQLKPDDHSTNMSVQVLEKNIDSAVLEEFQFHRSVYLEMGNIYIILVI